jgi:hypothetical protein
MLERIINKRLVYVLESRNLLPEQQYDIRKGRSTTNVLVILQNHIAEAFRKKESTTMVSLNISKAYDMSWRYAIIKKFTNWKYAVLHRKFHERKDAHGRSRKHYFERGRYRKRSRAGSGVKCHVIPSSDVRNM